MGPYQVLPCRARVDLAAIAMKGYSAFPNVPALLEPHHQIVLCHIQHTHGGYPSPEKQSVYSTAPADWARGVVSDILDCNIVVSEFELLSRYCIHFWTNMLGEGINPSNGLNGTTSVRLHLWLWYEVTHEVWYAIKQRNQTEPIFHLKNENL